MAQHNELGKAGERIAQNFLYQKGYEILETNWQYRHAEIDIIALKNNTLAVVEVKTRSSKQYGNPETFVNKKKIKLLIEAVNHYIEKQEMDVDIRFDIIAIVKNQYIEEIEHLEDAFYWY
jgi:putative endonuclease